MLRSEDGKALFQTDASSPKHVIPSSHIPCYSRHCTALLWLLLFPGQTSVDSLSAPLIKCWHKEGWYLAEPSLCFVLLLSRNTLYVHISHPTLKQSSRVYIILFIDSSRFSLFGFASVVQIQNLIPFAVSFCITYLHSVGNITE